MIHLRIQFSLVNTRRCFTGMCVWVTDGQRGRLGFSGMVNEAVLLTLREGKNPVTGQP